MYNSYIQQNKTEIKKMSNMKGFARAQAQYESRECPSYYEEYGCECGQFMCDSCTGENGWLEILCNVKNEGCHIARKDHLNSRGEVIVKKGQKYIYRYSREVMRNIETGEILPNVTITKSVTK